MNKSIIGIIVGLMFITRTGMALTLGIQAGKTGRPGIVSKTLQTGMVLGSTLVLMYSKKEIRVRATHEVQK